MACFFVYFDSFISQLCTKLKERERKKGRNRWREREERREVTKDEILSKANLNLLLGIRQFHKGKL